MTKLDRLMNQPSPTSQFVSESGYPLILRDISCGGHFEFVGGKKGHIVERRLETREL